MRASDTSNIGERPESQDARSTKASLEQKSEPGSRHDFGKNMLQLLPIYPLWVIGEVYTFGAVKKGYGEDNWRGGTSWRRVLGCLLRHVFKWACGYDNDEESGLPHLAHAGFCIMQLLEFSQTRTEFDDRIEGAARMKIE